MVNDVNKYRIDFDRARSSGPPATHRHLTHFQYAFSVWSIYHIFDYQDKWRLYIIWLSAGCARQVLFFEQPVTYCSV